MCVLALNKINNYTVADSRLPRVTLGLSALGLVDIMKDKYIKGSSFHRTTILSWKGYKENFPNIGNHGEPFSTSYER